MANNNNHNNEGKVTAGELFEKLRGSNGASAAPSGSSGQQPVGVAADEEPAALGFSEDIFSEEVFSETEGTGNGVSENGFSENGFSIDVSLEEESDSELDINELLKKYMPEYGEESDGSAVEPGGTGGGGVLSRLKRSADCADEDLPYGMDDSFMGEEDDRLISALDSAFGAEDDAEGGFHFADTPVSPESREADGVEAQTGRQFRGGKNERKKSEKKPFFLFGFGRKKAQSEAIEEEEEFFDEGFLQPGEEAAEEAPCEELSFVESAVEEPRAEDELVPEDEFAALTLSEEDLRFHTTDTRLGSIAEIDTVMQEPKPCNRSTPEMRKAEQEEESDLFADMTVDEFLQEEAEKESFAAAEDEAAVEEASVSADSEIVSFEESLPEESVAEEEIDPTDLNLCVAFGLDEEEHHYAGTAAKQLGDELEARQYRREKRAKLDRQEFVDKTQIPKIRKEQHNRLAALWVKLGLCVVFSIALMWFENVAFFTDLFTGAPKQFAGVFDPAVYPVVYIMTSLQLMLFACLCAYEQIIDGFKYLFRGIPRAESLLSFLTVTGIVYSAVLARVIDTPNEPSMFNFVVALAAVLTLVYSIYNTKREKMNFEIVSSKKTKHIMRRLPDEESMSQAQAFMEQTDACDVMKIEKTDFIDGFFARLYQPDSTVTIFMTCMMSVAAALAVLVGFFVNMKGGNSAEVLRAAYMTLLVSAPVFALVAFSYPFYRATKAANEYNSAIIGETSLGEYSNASIISFDDKNVFPSYSVKIQNIKIYNNARVDRVLYYAASVFSYAGGPLQDVFEVATLEMGHSEDVKIFDTEAGFLATQVNGVNIIFGSYNKLTEKGFVIPEENASDDIDFSTELSIMYMFREDKLVAKMYIKYVMDGDIDLILKQFQGTGLYVCVRTFDPNIDERMIAKKLNMRRIPLKVVRYANTEEVTKYEEKVDSGLVTNASPKSLLQVISYCDKVLHTRKANIAVGVLSVLIGIAIIGLMIMSGTVGLVTSLYIAVYHLLWVVPMILFAKVFIR